MLYTLYFYSTLNIVYNILKHSTLYTYSRCGRTDRGVRALRNVSTRRQLYTLYPFTLTLHSTLNTIYYILVHSTLYTPHSIPGTLYSYTLILYTVYCIIYPPHSTLYTVSGVR